MVSSIELFQFHQEYCRAIGIDSSESKKICFPFNRKNVVFVVCVAQFIAVTTAFLLFEAKTMLEYGMTFFAAISLTLTVTVYVINLWERESCSAFIKNCEKFIAKRECSKIAYQELNRKIELFCKLFCFAFVISPPLMTSSVLLFTIVNYCVLDLGKESFYLIFPVALPFDWRSPFGYPVAWLSQFAGGSLAYAIAIPFLNLFFGSCWLFIFIAEDITNDLTTFNRDGVKNENRVEIFRRFCDIVQLYSDAKRCVNDFEAINEYSLFAFFGWALLSICSILLTIQFQLLDENSNAIEIVITALFTYWTFALVFLMCEPGERVTSQFAMFGEELERCNWHKLSIEMQRMYVIFLSDTQQPINIESYGRVQCARETFKRVITKGYSYFAALRQIK